MCEQGTPNAPESVPVQFLQSFYDNLHVAPERDQVRNDKLAFAMAKLHL
jgi:hypothetical protein